MSLNITSIRVLVVARWPLGGIRTYMRYMFSHLPSSCRLSVLAASTQEDHYSGPQFPDSNLSCTPSQKKSDDEREE